MSLDIHKASFVGIMGPNGAGKSTLARLLTGYLKPSSGGIYLNRTPINQLSPLERAQKLALLPQEMHFSFPFTVEQLVLMARRPYQSFGFFESSRDTQRADQAIQAMDLQAVKTRNVNHLSGGERRRVMLAMALAQDPEILILDEATAHMDLKHQVECYRLLKQLHQEKRLTVILISHEISLASAFCQRMIFIKQGQIYADGDPLEIINHDLIKAVYDIDVTVDRSEKNQVMITG